MKGGLTNSFTTATNGKSYPIVPVPTSVVNNGIYTFRLLFQCDNNAIVQRVSLGTSHCLHIMYMYLLCNLFLSAARHNFTVATQHIISLPHYPISLYTSIIAFILTQPFSQLPRKHLYSTQHGLTSPTDDIPQLRGNKHLHGYPIDSVSPSHTHPSIAHSTIS